MEISLIGSILAWLLFGELAIVRWAISHIIATHNILPCQLEERTLLVRVERGKKEKF